ncbi:hypothetical protein FJ971_10090 [Mesorhizobium sp. B2-1-2]|nr:hypothetical protein FJ971_10090 [Mesorhizobium sp. B2-1-2]
MPWTIQSLIDERMRVTAYCSSCHHSQDLDLEELKARLGPDAPAMEWDLRPKLRCSQCQSKKVTLIYAPNSNLMSGMGKAHPEERS